MNENLMNEQTINLTSLNAEIYNQLTAAESQWLAATLQGLQQSNDHENDLLNASVLVKRTITSNLVTSIPTLAHCQSNEIIRLLLLVTLLTPLDAEEQISLLKKYYRGGDETEKCALLEGLNFLDEVLNSQGCAVAIAINATRCNSLVEYSALALNNDYPANYFPELNFNQLVLKSLFMGLDIQLINQLNRRLNPTLSNMCFDYAIEQALAERIPPASLWLAVRYQDLNEEHQREFAYYLKHFYRNNISHKTIISGLMQAAILPTITLE